MAEIIPFFPGAEAWNMQATAQQIDQCCGLGRGINLLDNWWFGAGVINQRGLITYHYPTINSTMSIDRWKIGKGASITLTDEGLSTISLSSNYRFMAQVVDSPVREYLTSKVVTLSALTKGGEGWLGEVNGLSVTIPASEVWTLTKITFTFRGTSNYASQNPAFFSTETENPMIIKCIKLELGPEQTLAHRDASGNWVLNDPPPNHVLELTKCQRHQVCGEIRATKVWRYDQPGKIGLLFPLGVPLRTKPTLVGSLNFIPNGTNSPRSLTTGYSLNNIANGVYVYISRTDADFDNIDNFWVGGFDSNI